MNRSTMYNKLNAKQVHILKLTHKFRFITAPLLAQYKGLKSRHSMYMTLERLAEQGYLGKRIESNTDFKNKGARYHITPQALKLLRDDHGFSDSSVFITHKNNKVSEEYVDRYIGTLKIYLSLRSTYDDAFHIFTSSELLDYDHFPNYKPDLYLNRIKPNKGATREYMLYNLIGTQLYIFKKQFIKLLDHFDSGDWEAETENNYPAILLVCRDGKTETKLQEHLNKVFDNTGIDDLTVLTTTLKVLKNSDSQNRAVWSNVLEPEDLVSL